MHVSVHRTNILLPNNHMNCARDMYIVVSNHWTGLLDWNTGMDYWTDIFLVYKHIAVVVVSLIDSIFLAIGL